MHVKQEMPRRRFMAQAAAAALATRLGTAHAQSRSSWVLIGTEKGEGIYRARWNGATGEFGKVELAFATEAPTFLAMHPSLPVVYSVNESSGSKAAVSSFQVDRATAELKLINQRETHGDAPCFVSVDHTGQMVFAANYGGGSMTAFRTDPDGGLAQTVGVFRYNQATHGPVADRQNAAHMHCATISPGNDFVIVCDLGDDLILVFPITPDQNSFVGAPSRVATKSGSGPRHVAFHPNGKWMYCINELDCTVVLYDWRVQDGQAMLTPREGSTISTLRPASLVESNTGAELVVSENGKFLYVCTRGVNTITVYTIDDSTGLLNVIQQTPCGGAIPRWIGFDPSRRWLVSTNQGSSTLTVFAHNRANGRLSAQPGQTLVNTPMFLLWV